MLAPDEQSGAFGGGLPSTVSTEKPGFSQKPGFWL